MHVAICELVKYIIPLDVLERWTVRSDFIQFPVFRRWIRINKRSRAPRQRKEDEADLVGFPCVLNYRSRCLGMSEWYGASHILYTRVHLEFSTGTGDLRLRRRFSGGMRSRA